MIKGRFAANLIANTANFGVGIVVGLWLTPYIIQHLGISNYGLIALAVSITAYLVLFVVTINSTVGRFLSRSMASQDNESASRHFSTSLISMLAVIAAVVPLVGAMITNSHYLLEVPAEKQGEFKLLLWYTSVAFMVTTIGGVFDAVLFCKNRTDVSSIINMVGAMIRVAVVIALFNEGNPRPSHVGIAGLVSSLACSVLTICIARYLAPEIKLGFRNFRWFLLTETLPMGMWVFVNAVGSLLLLSVEMILVNNYLGPIVAGKYGAILTWSLLLRGFGAVLNGLFSPTILSMYASGESSSVSEYAKNAIKFIGLFIALPIGVICGLSHQLIGVWLGEEFVEMAPILMILVFHLSINSAVQPLFSVQLATGAVRAPALMTCLTGFTNVLAMVFVLSILDLGMMGVAITGAVCLLLKNCLYTPWHASKILRREYWGFMRTIFASLCASVISTMVAWSVGCLWQVDGWPSFAVAGGMACAISMTAIWFLCVSNAEKHALIDYITSRLVKANAP